MSAAAAAAWRRVNAVQLASLHSAFPSGWAKRKTTVAASVAVAVAVIFVLSCKDLFLTMPHSVVLCDHKLKAIVPRLPELYEQTLSNNSLKILFKFFFFLLFLLFFFLSFKMFIICCLAYIYVCVLQACLVSRREH